MKVTKRELPHDDPKQGQEGWRTPTDKRRRMRGAGRDTGT